MVGTGGFEPLTSATRTQRSTRLNYVPFPNVPISTQKKIRLQAFFYFLFQIKNLQVKHKPISVFLYLFGKKSNCIK